MCKKVVDGSERYPVFKSLVNEIAEIRVPSL